MRGQGEEWARGWQRSARGGRRESERASGREAGASEGEGKASHVCHDSPVIPETHVTHLSLLLTFMVDNPILTHENEA